MSADRPVDPEEPVVAESADPVSEWADPVDDDVDAGRGGARPAPSPGRGRRRWARVLPWLRVVALAGAGAALVAGAARLPATDLSEGRTEAPGVTASGRAVQPVTETALACVGPPQLGLPDPAVPEQAQTVGLVALAGPEEVLGTELAALAARDAGHLELGLVPGGPPAVSTTVRGELLGTKVSTPQGVVVHADDGLAPAVTAGQWNLSRQEGQRGLSAQPCLPPTTDAWLLAGGGDPGRLERLVLVNPGSDPVTVRVDVHGQDGPLPAPGGQGVVVPGRDRVVLLLDALAPSEPAPAVHVTTLGGPVAVALADRWLEGTLDRGTELTVPTSPGTALVVPAVPAPADPDAGRTRLRVAVPGEEEAIVQVRALTPDGPARVENDVTTVAAGSVADLDLGTLPDGTHALEVTGDVPVVAALEVEQRAAADGAADMAWVPATARIERLAGAVLPFAGVANPQVRTGATLTLASPAGARVEVVVLDNVGATTSTEVDVPAAGAVTQDVAGNAAVWVRPLQGDVHAALTGTGPEDEVGPLVAGYPLAEVPVTQEVVPVRPWRP